MDANTSLLIQSNGTPVTQSISDIDLINRWRHVMGNANLRHELAGGGAVSVDLDYLQYHNRMPTENVNTSTDVATGVVSTRRLSSGKVTPLSILAVKSDYRTNLQKWEFGAGVKVALSRFMNEPTFLAPLAINGRKDIDVSSTTHLREHLTAGYGSAIYQPTDAATVEIGMRYELTDANLDIGEKTGWTDRRYGSLFPGLMYSYNASDEFQLTGSYTRPAFNDLASFSRYDDPYVIATGNMGLQPAVLTSVKFNVTYRDLLASVEYAWEDSTIARFQSQIFPGTNVQIIAPMNFSGMQSVTALLGRPAQLAGWWSAHTHLMLIWKEVDGLSNNIPVTIARTSVQINSTQNLRLPGHFVLEASGFYQGPTLFGTMRFGSMWGGVDLGPSGCCPVEMER